MAKFLSPGVFTNETDLSFLEQGVSGIGAAVIGRTQKGPAFVATKLADFNQHLAVFGNVDPNMPATYGSKNYLKSSTVLNVVRVLGHSDGTAVSPGYSVGGMTGIADMTGSSAQVLAVVHHSGTSSVVSVVGVNGDSNKFVFTVGSFSVTASFLTSSAEYIGKVLNTDPTRYSTDNHYLYQVFKYATPLASASWCAVNISGALTSFAKNYEGGVTPYVKSQLLGGNEYNLFRFYTIGDGRATNDEIKVCIQNIKPSVNPASNPYGTFDVVVRDFYDNDLRPKVLDTFVGCNLDPNSSNYVARRIGDSYETFDTTNRKFVAYGSFPSKSKYIRIDMNLNNGAPKEALPWGHVGYQKSKFHTTNTNGTGIAYTIPSLNYQPNQFDANGNYNANIYWGVQFVSGGIVDRMRAYPVYTTAQESTHKVTDTDFSLSRLSASYLNGRQIFTYNTAVNSFTPIFASASMQKFTMPFQGGFDGFDLRVADPLYIANSADDTDLAVVSLKRAIDTIANPDLVDINLLAIPGIDNLKVTDYARTMVNNRQDALYIMDATGSTVAEVIDQLKNREIDDNYAATYYSDVKINDKVNNRIVRLKPSAVAIGAIAYSDKVSQQWFAPAGMNRGGLTQFDVVDTVDRLDFKDRDNLYDNRINPLASFPDEGIVIFGQKTLQAGASSLDRINVRRLLIFAKKTIAAAAKYLVFEPNNPSTYQKFLNTVNPILDRVRQGQGIERFQVVMDSNVNTPDVVDRNVMVGKIFLQPIKSAEFIDLSFIITNAGVQFNS